MAVTLTAAQLREAMRMGDTTEENAEVARLLSYATEAITKHVATAPDAVHNEAAIRLASYLIDQPNAGRGAMFANALQNSGAASILLPYRVHRAGSVAGATTAAESPGPAGLSRAEVEGIVAAAIAALPTPPTLPMPATPAEAAGGTSTTIRGWTAALIRAAVNAVVPAVFREGNTDTIPPEKLPPQTGGGGESITDLGTYAMSIDTVNSFYATGITLPTDKTWLFVSLDTHTETTPGPPPSTNSFAPGPWVRVLIEDLIGRPSVSAGDTRTDVNAIEDVADAQNFRPLEFGAASDRELMVAIPHLNSGATIAGSLRFKVS